MRKMLRRAITGVVVSAWCALGGVRTWAASTAPTPLTPVQMDALVQRAMAAFRVPGIAVGIVKDGQLVYARGYGTRTVGTHEAVDADTVFAIGSNTKAFTTAALSLLVDEGKLHWEDKVIDWLPRFQLQDPWVTREFTVRDLLTHRSGLGLGAGDLMFVPQTDFSREEVLYGLRFLKPASSFRSQFAYDNLLYIVAGELIPAVTGMPWDQFVDSRILRPLGMAGCASGLAALPKGAVLATPHSVVADQVTPIAPMDLQLAAAAGAIHCNVTGMARWMQTQLAGGAIPGGGRLFTAERQQDMWTPQTLLPVGGALAALSHTHFQTYALGWGITDFEGYQRISHQGGVLGMVTQVSLMPELHLGVVVLTNQEDPGPLLSIADAILESYVSSERHDWVGSAKTLLDRAQSDALATDAARAPKSAAPALDMAQRAPFVGHYADPWRGAATVSESDGSLRLVFSRTHSLQGRMDPAGPDLFIVQWDDRSLHADAYVRFRRDYAGQPDAFTMQAVSVRTDFSFDFQDLDFHRVRVPAAP